MNLNQQRCSHASMLIAFSVAAVLMAGCGNAISGHAVPESAGTSVEAPISPAADSGPSPPGEIGLGSPVADAPAQPAGRVPASPATPPAPPPPPALSTRPAPAGTGPAGGSAARAAPAAPGTEQSPSTTRRSVAPTRKSPSAPGVPAAAGSGAQVLPAPLNIPPFQIRGATFSSQRANVEETIKKACGGPLCVNILTPVDSTAPQDPGKDCEVVDIDQKEFPQPGDSFTFTLANPCDD